MTYRGAKTIIVQQGDPVLRQIAEPIPVASIPSPTIQRLIGTMQQALKACDDGVALAAPQIGISKKLFVVAGRFFPDKNDQPAPDMVFINPVLKKMAKKKVVMDEGCLSVRNVFGQTKRAERATVEAYDEKGRKFARTAAGLLAQVFQHEIDHLNGILFTDHATDLQTIKPTTS